MPANSEAQMSETGTVLGLEGQCEMSEKCCSEFCFMFSSI